MKNKFTQVTSVTGLLKTAIFVTLTLSLVASCKKDTNDGGGDQTTTTTSASTTSTVTPTPAKTKTEILTGSSWVMTAATISPAMQGMTDMYAMMQDCEKDNVYMFKKDYSFIEDEGASKCNMMDPQQSTSVWQFASNETQIMLGQMELNIISMKEKEVKVSHTETMGETDYTVTQTWTAK